jgi:thiamine biosynthesis lipoprotein
MMLTNYYSGEVRASGRNTMNLELFLDGRLYRCRPLIAAIALCLGAHSAPAADTLARYEFTEPQMGVPFKIVVYAAEDEIANRAARAAFARIEKLNAILSDYEDDSELVRLSRGSPHDAPATVSDDLFRVLALSQELAQRSDGAFDVSVGPLVQLWRRARRQRALPASDLLQRARAAVDYRAIKLDAKQQTVQLTKPRMRLDLGGIGIGYAVDEALRVLKDAWIIGPSSSTPNKKPYS